MLPLSVNMLPICQSIPFAVQSLYWLYHGMGVPQCPNTVLYKFDEPQFYFCWFAGGFNLGWPMLIPIGLVVVASYYMILASFVECKSTDKGGKKTNAMESFWENEDGQIRPTCGSKRLTLLGYILNDMVGMLPIVMAIYGVIPAILSYWNCLVRGNHFDFVSAAKGNASSQQKADVMGAPCEKVLSEGQV